jgi:Spy/CpxP family protein refolding chaperone
VSAVLSLAACAGGPAVSPYAGEQGRPIKALSQKEMTDLLDGAGMGYAKAAELNRFPGPMHTLELAKALELSDSQRTAIESILAAHKAEARKLGADVVRLERELDDLFAKGNPAPEAVNAIAARLGSAVGQLRASHLNAHIATTRLLEARQVDRYVELRGYGGAHGHH